jgi:hypothetical protein
MTQKLMLAGALIVSSFMSLNAQSGEDLVIRAGKVKSVMISDQIDLVLIPANPGENQFVMGADAVEKLNIEFSRNTLMISPKGFMPKKQRRQVFLYVNNLENLAVGPNSSVRTVGILNAADIQVYVDENTQAHVRTYGHIEAHPMNGIAIKVEDIAKNRATTKGF